jgi:CheY-like chemotaxis protein
MTVLERPRQEAPELEYAKGTETILLAEDMDPLRQVISDSLEQLGYRVISACTGEDALGLAAAFPDEIHLLLSDVVMPQMKGPELARRLGASRPQVKVIYISGYPSNVLAPYGVLEPGIFLLHKPFSIKVLSSKLREVLDG